MNRILFVDDEPNVLRGLQRMLRVQRERWDMTFVEGAEAALTEAERESFDVVVSDIRMPGMDGATLLERICAGSPTTMRIVLSGHSDEQATARALAASHRFLLKPSRAATLVEVVERACRIREITRPLMASPLPWPGAPEGGIAVAPNAAGADSPGDPTRGAVLPEPLLTHCQASLGSRESFSFLTATTRLGAGRWTALWIASELLQRVAPADLRGHAVAVARVSAEIAPEPRTRPDAYIAGLLHDVGKLPLLDVQGAPATVDHEAAGAYLACAWSLPLELIEAIAFHHTPGAGTADAEPISLAGLIHVADALVHEYAGAMGRLNTDYLMRVGALARVPVWRARVGELLDRETLEPPR